ncbi:MAG: SpoIIE family protein phosphatase [Bacteroidetes bacterium]|nr:SpoIIE family protein phosphatase [Bacteroidota bacterium]
MDNTAHISYDATDRSYFSLLKKEIHNLVTGAGFSATKTGEVDLIISEITSNLVKHGGGGEILFKINKEGDNAVAEIIAIDNGKGMADAGKMVQDGVSTTNTLGHGLGSMKRLADTFQVYSLKDWGTIILCRVYKKPLPPFTKKPIVDVRSVNVPKPGEKFCGDGYASMSYPGRTQIFLADGLGHGEEAHNAVAKAVACLPQYKDEAPCEIMRNLHKDVKRTRGLVGTMIAYEHAEKKWRICGIGNIATKIQTAGVSKSYLAYNGIVGMNIPTTLNEQIVSAERGQIIIMCSDGIKSHWDVQKYAGIQKYDLSILAAAIYKDFARRTDDMSVLVSRVNVTT